MGWIVPHREHHGFPHFSKASSRRFSISLFLSECNPALRADRNPGSAVFPAEGMARRGVEPGGDEKQVTGTTPDVTPQPLFKNECRREAPAMVHRWLTIVLRFKAGFPI